MASAYTSGSEENFSCSICLDVFNSPVTTACGHNFCRTCITTFWDDQVQYKCPVCNELFHTRPDLRVNNFISEMVDQFRRSVRVKEQPCVEPGEVPCDVCTGTQLKAVKSCLVCLISYCHTHLEPHQRVAGLKKHLLVDPLDRLEDRMCKKHDRLLELFCQTEQVCVCLLCTVTDHKSHPVVPLKEEYEVKMAQLGKMESDIQQMILDRQQKIQEIKDTLDRSKADADREIADGLQVLTALKRCIEKLQDDLNQTVKEKLKSTEKEAEGLIKELQQEIEDLTSRSSEVKQLSHTEDHLHVLQTFTSLKNPPPTRDWTTVKVCPPSYVGTVRRSLDQLEDTLNMEMNKLHELCVQEGRQGQRGHFTLVCRDSAGQLLGRGGEKFLVSIVNNDKKNCTVEATVVNNDGSFSVSYKPTEPGSYSVWVRVKAQHVKGSPLTLRVNRHAGTFHICTSISSGGSGYGYQNLGYVQGCIHGRKGHPGQHHWSCCGSTQRQSECPLPLTPGQ